MKIELKDWLNSINFNKQDLTADDPTAISSYPPYIINRCLSGTVDSILFANEMNMNAHVDKDMQYCFLPIYFEEKEKVFPLVEERTSRGLGSGQKTLWI